jgi:hypothetical protein
MDHFEISRKGGNTTMARYGREHFARLGKKGAETKIRIYGPDYFKKLSALGLAARRKRALDNTKQAVV